MSLGYYGGYPEFETAQSEDNLIGFGLDYEDPLNVIEEENLISGPRHIRQCIFDILTTQVGSRFFNPEYGSRLYEVYDEPNDFIACDMSQMYVIDAIQRWEPRVQVLEVTATTPDDQIGRMNVHITYRIRNTNEVDSFVYSYNRQVPKLV